MGIEVLAAWADSFLSLGLILGVFLFELILKLLINPVHQFGVVEEQERYDEISQRLRGTALSVAGLVFGGLAIIVSSNVEGLTHPIEAFSVSFGFLLIAAFSHEMSLTYRIVLTLQELALEYGLLILVYSLFEVIQRIQPSAADVAFVVLISVILFRFASLKGELEAHNLEFKNSEFDSQREYFNKAVRKWVLYFRSLLRI